VDVGEYRNDGAGIAADHEDVWYDESLLNV